MNNLINTEEIKIENMIYEIRGKQVMLDSDLAKLYHCTNGTKDINKAVKRNIERFPEDFYFQLTNEEINSISSRFQIGTLNNSNNKRGHNIKYLPYVFTEHGIAMLASVLHTDIANEISIKIIRSFIAMRNFIGHNEYRISNLETKVIDHDNNIKLLQQAFDKLNKDKEINELYFDGKEYDAHSKILDIFNTAKDELIIIDRYTDKTILDIIKNLKCNVILITGSNSKLTNTDIEKYNKTYSNLKIIYNDTFHDRYFIIDKKTIYHSGNSINHIGYRKSSIDILGDENIINTILNDIEFIVK